MNLDHAKVEIAAMWLRFITNVPLSVPDNMIANCGYINEKTPQETVVYPYRSDTWMRPRIVTCGVNTTDALHII